MSLDLDRLLDNKIRYFYSIRSNSIYIEYQTITIEDLNLVIEKEQISKLYLRHCIVTGDYGEILNVPIRIDIRHCTLSTSLAYQTQKIAFARQFGIPNSFYQSMQHTFAPTIQPKQKKIRDRANRPAPIRTYSKQSSRNYGKVRSSGRL